MKNTNFKKLVLDCTKLIPRGNVVTYGDIASKIGKPRSARAVGNALNKNELPIKIPCHRVVRGDGSVGGYGFGAAKKIKILKEEGVSIRNGRVENFEKFRYRLD